MTDEQKIWLDTELWNFVHAAALDLGITNSSGTDPELYTEVRRIIEQFDRVSVGGSRE